MPNIFILVARSTYSYIILIHIYNNISDYQYITQIQFLLWYNSLRIGRISLYPSFGVLPMARYSEGVIPV